MSLPVLLTLYLWCCVSVCWIQISSVEAGKCLHDFPDPVLRKKFIFQGEVLPLTISHGDRASHLATAHLTKILLEEGLGYSNVKLIHCDYDDIIGTSRSCWKDRFSDTPPQAMIEPEVRVLFDRQDPETSETMTDIGPLGIMGRPGWFISADFVDHVWAVNQKPADHWRALQLPVVLQQLSSVLDLIICQGCIKHEFHPPQCSQANPTGGRCAFLLAGHRDNTRQLLLDQITSLQLNISVVWLGERLRSTIIENKARGKPLLFYIWDPDPLTITGDFSRISFPDCKIITEDPKTSKKPPMMQKWKNNRQAGCGAVKPCTWKLYIKEGPDQFRRVSDMVKAIRSVAKLSEDLHEIEIRYFVLTSKGELKSEDNCLDYNGYDLYLRECDGLKQNQRWVYKDNTLYHPRRDVCIDRGSASSEHARVRACDGRTVQMWEFSKTDDMD